MWPSCCTELECCSLYIFFRWCVRHNRHHFLSMWIRSCICIANFCWQFVRCSPLLNHSSFWQVGRFWPYNFPQFCSRLLSVVYWASLGMQYSCCKRAKRSVADVVHDAGMASLSRSAGERGVRRLSCARFEAAHVPGAGRLGFKHRRRLHQS